VVARYIGIGGGSIAAREEGAGPEFESAILTQTQFEVIEEAARASADIPEITETSPTQPDVGSIQETTTFTAPALELADDGSRSGELSGGGDLDGETIGAAGGSGGAGASFFGVEATGTRFAFILDVSSSMAEEDRIERLRRELAKTIERLDANIRIYVVAFAAGPTIVSDRDDWSDATPAAKRSINNRMAAIPLQSATEPLGAFQKVFAIRPRPEAIYFMTDGEFPENIVEEIAVMNREVAPAVPVHCICFGVASGEELMRRIAVGSRGTYTFVPSK
jgi:hypothetical protein